jgi:hypothetical protein
VTDPEDPGATATAAGNTGVAPAARRGADGRFARDPTAPSRGWKQGRPGAPAGNLHGSRNPWRTFWQRRALRPKDRWVLALIEDYVPSMAADKPEATAAEANLMQLAAVSRLCWLLALARQEADGGPDLSAVARFVSEERAALLALGLERRTKTVDPMEAVRHAVARVNQRSAE